MIKIYRWATASQRDKARIMARSQADMEAIKPYVAKIIADVRKGGDTVIVRYTRKFDNLAFAKGMIRVSAADIRKAYRNVSSKIIRTMREQIRISSTYAKTERQKLVDDWKIETTRGVETGMRLTPIESVGLYVPAGDNRFRRSCRRDRDVSDGRRASDSRAGVWDRNSEAREFHRRAGQSLCASGKAPSLR